MRTVVICLVCLLLALPALPCAAGKPFTVDAPPLRIGVGIDRAPFSMRTSSGSLTGFDVDIARAISRELGRPCLLVAWSLTRLRDALEHDELDMLVAGLARTPEREKTMLFSEPYCRMPSIFIAHKGNPRDTRRTMWHVLTQTGSIQEDYLHTRSAEFASVWTLATHQDIWDALVSGDVDAALIDGLPGFTFLLSPRGVDFELAGHPVSTQDLPDSSHIAFGLSSGILRDQTDAALKTLRRNGTYTAISRKHFPFDVD